MTGRVEGRVAVVTGGASGIGRATALVLAREGAKAIVIADLQREPREGGEPTDALVSATCNSTFVTCDVSQTRDLEAAVAAADEFGGVDVMANVAGIIVTGRFLDVTEDDFDRQMAINVKGTFFGTQAAARRMRDLGRGGSIVNVSSVAGLAGSAIAPVYSASKGAVKLLSYAAAQALGPRSIRVNVVHPGMVNSAMSQSDVGVPADAATGVPLGRDATPEDVAEAIVFLASDQAAFINGTSLVVDGGFFNTLH